MELLSSQVVDIPNMRQKELAEPFLDRVLNPLLGRMGEFTKRITPIGMRSSHSSAFCRLRMLCSRHAHSWRASRQHITTPPPMAHQRNRPGLRARSRCAGAASHPGSKHIDLATWREGIEAVLNQPADGQQAS